MAVRAFTTGDILDCATGALATSTFGTYAVIVKRGAINAWHTFLALHNSSGSALTQFAYNDTSGDNRAVIWIDGTTVTGPAAIGTTAWGLVVVRKATGTATPRFSLYNFTTATWTHGNASGTRPNWTAPGAGTVRFRWETFDQLAGRVAVRAAWNSLPWSADTTGDAAIEAAGLHTSLQNWVDATPAALWAFNQDAVTTAVTDLTGNGADQTARTGTTVVTGDDPPGFSFTLGGSDVTGTATGSGGGAGTANGIRERVGTGSGLGGGAGTASGIRERVGTANGVGGAVGAASGAPEAAEVTGTAAGTGGGVGAAVGVRERIGTAAGQGGGVGAATGVVETADTSGTATGSGGGTGAGVGTRERVGVAIGSGGGVGSAIGTRERVGQATGSAAGAGNAAGVSETIGVATGSGGGVGLVVVLPPVTRGGSALLERTAPGIRAPARTAATASLMSRTISAARGGS